MSWLWFKDGLKHDKRGGAIAFYNFSLLQETWTIN